MLAKNTLVRYNQIAAKQPPGPEPPAPLTKQNACTWHKPHAQPHARSERFVASRKKNQTPSWRYNKHGQLIPAAPAQPKKQRSLEALERQRALAQSRADTAEPDRRSSQSRIAALDSLEAARLLADLRTFARQPQPADLILPLVDWLATQHPGLRRRFVELTEYEAKHEQNERLKRLMKKTAELVEAGRPNRKQAA